MGNENIKFPFKFCMQLGTQGGCTKMPFLKVAALLFSHGNNGCLFEAWGLIFMQKRRKKKKSEMFISLSQAKYNTTNWHFFFFIVTSFVFTLIHSIFPGSECEHTNRLFISVQFRSFLLSGETGNFSKSTPILELKLPKMRYFLFFQSKTFLTEEYSEFFSGKPPVRNI